MSIKQDNSTLPRQAAEGNPPDANPRFGHLLAEAWAALDAERFHEKSRTDVDRYIRLGWAGQCARAIGYKLLEVDPSNPSDIAASWRMGLGTMVHEGLQEAVQRAFPGAQVEKLVGAEHDEAFGFPVSGRSDLFLVTTINGPGGELNAGESVTTRTVVEIKTINGFGFKKAVGARGTPEGARSGAIFQAALNGRAHQADEVVILYLSLECLSDRELGQLVDKQGGEADPIRKFVAEWSYPMVELDEMVDRELARLSKIVKMTDDAAALLDATRADATQLPGSVLPPRSIPLEMPSRARVTDPMKGTWQVVADGNVMDAGTVWQCAGYCNYRDRCTADGPS